VPGSPRVLSLGDLMYLIGDRRPGWPERHITATNERRAIATVRPMRHKALIAVACVLVFGAFWVWPAFDEPADHSCTSEETGSWSYKVESRTWNCDELGWHIGRYGFTGIQ